MDIILAMLFTFFILILSVYKGIFVGFPLLLGFLIFAFISFKKGFMIKDIFKMSVAGGKKAIVVLNVFVLIGCITGIWMASGTVPAIIYFAIKYMNLNFFILYAFLISCIVSFLLGTCFGTVSTVGVALMLMAKNGNANINIVAGAIIAGSYFGDRCSPMSSSANLISNLTETNLFINVRNMFKTSLLPFILCVIFYTILSIKHPLNLTQSNMDVEILNTFTINWIILLPAILILFFSLFKVNVKISMLVSILSACIIAIIFQHYTLVQVFKFIVLGFNLDSHNSLQNIFKGGGIISMCKAAFVVFISCALAGIFNETNMLSNIEVILTKAQTRCSLFIYTTITSIFTAAFGCNQSIAIVLTHQLMDKSYETKNIDKYKLAIDLENTAVLLSALIPWNIAAFVPTTTMDVSGVGFMPFALYIYLVPLTNIIFLKISDRKNLKYSINS
ncbi:Na+/H+ antiporter NhaC family protein [Clostridium senegalense]|uniref:Na+/H+ antiporter NhaC family protein n=1 Tax=Clostridium senegalense TaxID=1465809 RepID=UPI000288DEE8|nr:Na+/H+ antiporter NhaC family protein [Clostridium senegalense]